jgi:hypothetical protein
MPIAGRFIQGNPLEKSSSPELSTGSTPGRAVAYTTSLSRKGAEPVVEVIVTLTPL